MHSEISVASAAIERSVGTKVIRRLVIPCALFILIGAIDRTNVGFAALQMNRDLGLTGTEFGFGAGILFVGYALAKYPSVLFYEAAGMRRWLATITLAWGIFSAAMSTVSGLAELFALRIAIGFAEGGLSSGLMLYLSSWAPERYRASILAIPIVSISVAQVIGAPISGALLDWDNPFGIAPWRLMFVVEALPALALALFAYLWFPDRPDQAHWLSNDERAWITANVRSTRREKGSPKDPDRWIALRGPLGWLCAGAWFCILAGNYGIMFWLPQIVKGVAGLSAFETGLIVALPWAASGIGLIINAWHSDSTGERYLHVATPAVVGGLLLPIAFLLGPGAPGLFALVLGGGAIGCTVAAFWAIPPRLIPPGGLAMAFVMINMLGSFAGATIPPLMGALREVTGSFLPPTLLITLVAFLCVCFVLALRRQARKAGLE